MKTVNGLRIEEVDIGAGSMAERGCTVEIEWRGWLNRGEEFRRGIDTFEIGRRTVIAGLEYGVTGMRIGGVRKLRVSPHLGYRDQSVPGIPPNALLNFEVKLLAVKDQAKQSKPGL